MQSRCSIPRGINIAENLFPINTGEKARFAIFQKDIEKWQ